MLQTGEEHEGMVTIWKDAHRPDGHKLATIRWNMFDADAKDLRQWIDKWIEQHNADQSP